jgi:UDP-3-O-[3-hydroxymyristoyl] N-acetylglucosamine deacetylase
MTQQSARRAATLGASPVTVLSEAGTPPEACQHTLAAPVRCSGVGLHTGRALAIHIHPAPPDSGVRMRRTDLPGQPAIPATWAYAQETPLCTTLADGTTRIATVEHLLAALAGLGVDNATIDVDGPEVPVMDGSAAPFVFLIECVGVAAQPALRRAIRLTKTVAVADGQRSAALEPAPAGLTVDFEIAFDSPVIGHQARRTELDAATFKRDLARARTFGFLADVEQLRAAGLALGGSLDNAVVIDGDRVLNDGGLRYPDEFVRHKILDCVGDLFLAGAPLIARFTGRRTGHALNRRLLAKVFADPEAWTWADTPPAETVPAATGAAALPDRAVAQRA